jgi:hypothetical protein
MVIHGRIHNGKVLLEDGPALPEGAPVTVSFEFASGSGPSTQKKRIDFPLVRSKRPGSVHLTGERVAEFLEEDDVSP